MGNIANAIIIGIKRMNDALVDFKYPFEDQWISNITIANISV
jgi:hypothetical protein